MLWGNKSSERSAGLRATHKGSKVRPDIARFGLLQRVEMGGWEDAEAGRQRCSEATKWTESVIAPRRIQTDGFYQFTV